MKSRNIQIIDGAVNSTYHVYKVPKFLFDIMFPNDTNVAFLDEVSERLNESNKLKALDEVQRWSLVYKHKLDKSRLRGIHGTLHLTGSSCDKRYFPDRTEIGVVNRA